ncbi:MAG TPA: MFS transporter [Miltoncostaeaceae bacterium]|nr:MFS transporter [Miltoncostaeaceae bacterium]
MPPSAPAPHAGGRPVGLLVAASLVARVADLTVALPVVLLVVDATGAYALAGLVAGALTLGAAVAAPLLGRLADRVGHRPVVGASAVLSALALAVLALTADLLAPTALVALGAAAGLASPPIEATVRALLSRSAEGPRLQRLLALDTTAQEAVFIAAPPLHVAVAALVSPAAAVLLVAALLVGGTLAMLLSPLLGLAVAGRGAGRRAYALRETAVRRLSGVALCIGTFFGAATVGVIALADEAGREWLAGPLVAVWALGSLVGGLAVIARPPRAAAERRLWLLLVASAALAVGPALAAGSVWAVVPLLALQGLTIAPALASHAESVALAAPAGGATEAFAWTTSAMSVGAAGGHALAGLVIDAAGASAALGVAVVPLALAAVQAAAARPAVAARRPAAAAPVP